MSVQVRVRKDTWHYRLWRFTYFFEDLLGVCFEPPEEMIYWRYWSRMFLTPIPICLGIVALTIVVVTVLTIGNSVTILSGTGLFLIGHNKKGVTPFPSVEFGQHRISMRTIAGFVYALLGIATLVYVYPSTSTYMVYGACVLGVLILARVMSANARARLRLRWLLFKHRIKAKWVENQKIIVFDDPEPFPKAGADSKNEKPHPNAYIG